MAGDWIKLEHATADKPEVFRISETLSIAPEHALGCLIRIWVWADQQIEKGNALSVTETTIDRIARVTGFGEAMTNAGWLVVTETEVLFPNFDRHNGQTSKTRALTAKRVAKHKAGKGVSKGNAKVTLDALPKEEKSIIEETDLVLCKIPDCLDTQEFRNAWIDWLKHSQHVRGQNLSEQHQKTKLADFMRCGVTEAIRDIRHSIAINAKNVHSKCKPKESDGNPQPKIDGERVATMAEFRAAYGCKEKT
jgi:hypothetical protein